MKRNHLLTTGALCLALAAASCCRQAPAPQAKASAEPVSLKDHGAEPTVLNIESHTLANENFRTALWTGSNLQVTLMAIPAGGDVGLEQHHDIDQFLRVEEGTARVMMGDSEDNLDFVREVSDDYAILVPAGKWHNIVNTGDKPLKIYSIYAPAEHPHGTVHKTRQEALDSFLSRDVCSYREIVFCGPPTAVGGFILHFSPLCHNLSLADRSFAA